MPAAQFLQSAMTTELAADELVVSVRYPRRQPGEAAAYRMFNQRHGDYALVAVAATLTLAQGRVVALRLGIGGVAPVPLLLSHLTEPFLGEPPSARWVVAVARAARDAVQPEEHARVPAAYRRELTETLVSRALDRCTVSEGAVA